MWWERGTFSGGEKYATFSKIILWFPILDTVRLGTQSRKADSSAALRNDNKGAGKTWNDDKREAGTRHWLAAQLGMRLRAACVWCRLEDGC